VNSMITADGDDAIVIYSVLGNEDTNEIGTTTAELDAHDDGITIEAGTNTYVVIATTNDEGTDTTRLVGTVLGKFEYDTTASDGDDAIMMISSNGIDDTYDNGTITGLDHVSGTTTDDEIVTYTKAVVGTNWIRLLGAVVGTFSHEIITADGDETMVK
jgi:hypothetical protein